MNTNRLFHILIVLALVLAVVPVTTAFAASTRIVDNTAGSGCSDPAGPIYCTIQAAIDASSDGDTILVYPGTYNETATNRLVLGTNGPHQFGLFIDKHNLTIQGVDSGGVPLTDYHSLGAYVTTNATNNFGYSGIFVQGDHVTLVGLHIGPNAPGDNKTIEIIGDGFTLKDSHVDVPGGGSVYFDDWQFDTGTGTSHIQSYTIDHNLIDQSTSIDISSGAGYTGAVSGRLIINNEFENADYWPSISFNGSGTGVPWFVQSVGGAVIKDNTFTNTFNGTDVTAAHIRVRGTVENNQFAWEDYWNGNTFNKAVVNLVGAYPPFDVRMYNYTSGTYSFDVRRIGVNIQSGINTAQASDTVLVKDGVYPESPRIDKSLTLRSSAGRDVTTIELQTGPTYLGALTLDGADVTVEGFTIIGRDGTASTLASSNIFVTTLPDLVQIFGNRIKVGAIAGSSNGDDGFGLLTTYSTTAEVESLIVNENIFEPANASGTRAFYINPGVNRFQFFRNEISGNFTRTAITQAKEGVVAENLLTGTGSAGSRSAGLGTWGYPDPTLYGHTTFKSNTITGVGKGIAVFATNDVVVENNFFIDNDTAMWIGDSASLAFDPGTIHVNQNSIENSELFGAQNASILAGTVNAESNWWNSPDGPQPAGNGDAVSGDVDYTPWLCVDIDTSLEPGYQPLPKTDCAGPITTNVLASPNPAAINGSVTVTATVDDSTTGGSKVASADYSLDNGGSWLPMAASDGSFDEASEGVTVTFNAPASPAVYDLCVRGTDAAGNVGEKECTLLVIYDPAGGFVTGGGWIDSPAGAVAPIETTVFFNGFEADVNGWFTPTRVPSGTNGISSASGSYHAQAVTGNYTNWGGYNAVFPLGGYITSVDIYLDLDAGYANDTRFDWSSAISTPANMHRRDFVITGGFYNDATGPGAGQNRFVFSASNNTPGWPKNPDRDPFAVTTTGWYTLQHRFYDSGAGILAVEMSILDSGGNVLHSWTLSDPTDVIGTTIGGNRYGWLVNSGFPFLAIDNSFRKEFSFATGKATFGFVSKYKKGATVPDGNTEFKFVAGNLNFSSTSYEWLVVNQSGTNAQFKGSGTINGLGNYGFMLWATDGSPDKFRIKIWDAATGVVLYDNGTDQAIGGGSIVVHKK